MIQRQIKVMHACSGMIECIFNGQMQNAPRTFVKIDLVFPFQQSFSSFQKSFGVA